METPPAGCGDLRCIVAGTHSPLLHRQGAALWEEGCCDRRVWSREVVSGWHLASGRAVMGGKMNLSGGLVEMRLPMAGCTVWLVQGEGARRGIAARNFGLLSHRQEAAL